MSSEECRRIGRWCITTIVLAMGTSAGITPVATAQGTRIFADCIVHQGTANKVDWTRTGVIWTSPHQSLYGCEGWLYAMAFRVNHIVYVEWGSRHFAATADGRIAEWNASQKQSVETIPDYMGWLIGSQTRALERLWEAWFTQAGQAYFSPQVRIVAGRTGAVCGKLSNPSDSFYCSRDHTVYLGRHLLEIVLSRGGNFPPAVVLSHERGHHIQFLLGILESYNTKSVEIQADCFAGIYAEDVARRGQLDVGDADSAIKLMLSIGDPEGLSPWFSPSAHGNSEERGAAFLLGAKEGIAGCRKLR